MAPTQGDTQEIKAIDTESYKRCRDNTTCGDLEADEESREWRLLEEQTRAELTVIIARFWAKVEKTETCWLWTASTGNKYGHGQFTIRDESRRQHHLGAHRVAWALGGRHVGPNLKICHTCDIPRCVRLEHLFIGTQQENLDDARAKGRLVDGLGSRKLSDDAYRDILSAPHAYGICRALAGKHGVSDVTISRIRHGRQGITYRNSLKIVSQPLESSRQRDQPRQSVHAQQDRSVSISAIR